MNNLEANLQNIFSYLQEKMYHAKTIHIRYTMMDKHRLFLIRQSVLSIYASWEGFLKESLLLYLQELNKLYLSYDQISDEYLAFQTDNICSFKNIKTNQEIIKKVSLCLLETYKQKVNFNTRVNTESNANLKVANNLLKKLSLNELSEEYEKELNRLLFFRNSIAHGDDGIKIKQKDLDIFSLLVQDLAYSLIISILDGFNNRVYLKTA